MGNQKEVCCEVIEEAGRELPKFSGVLEKAGFCVKLEKSRAYLETMQTCCLHLDYMVV